MREFILVIALSLFVSKGNSAPVPKSPPHFVICECFDRESRHSPLVTNFNGSSKEVDHIFLVRKHTKFPESYASVHGFLAGEKTGYRSYGEATKAANEINERGDFNRNGFEASKALSCDGYFEDRTTKNDWNVGELITTVERENYDVKDECKKVFPEDSLVYYREEFDDKKKCWKPNFLRHKLKVAESRLQATSGIAASCRVVVENAHPCSLHKERPSDRYCPKE